MVIGIKLRNIPRLPLLTFLTIHRHINRSVLAFSVPADLAKSGRRRTVIGVADGTGGIGGGFHSYQKLPRTSRLNVCFC
ncbi:hypothetical protein F511_18809 [Dorcoceras hygrometricum]|uniref:Uncharacterized protein n=1 Tax=Dorcoceras hygrometricum TaxID=472368 RepID=A0A2Z7CUF0_9LAMI|nr:hypothetical protein F511_18809 [Dorcoceras hygrometricum]